MADTKSTRRNIYLPDDLWTRVAGRCMKEELATGERVSASQWIRRAIRESLTKKGKA